MNNTESLAPPAGAELMVYLFVFGIPLILMIGSIIDILRSTFSSPSNKLIWLLIVIFLPLLGSLIYLLIGRNKKASIS